MDAAWCITPPAASALREHEMSSGDAPHYDYHINSYSSSYFDAQGVFQPVAHDTHTTLAPTQEPLHASASFPPLGASSETPALNASPVDPERTDDIAAVLARQRRQVDEMQNRIKALESQLAGTKRASEANDREGNVGGGNGKEGNSREEKGRKKRKLGGLMLLTEEQSKMKKRLMKEVRDEIKRLTGRGKSGQWERFDNYMPLDLEGTATSEGNRLVIQQAAKTVTEAHKHPLTGQYGLEGQPFTLADCVSFASTAFNSWKAAAKIKGDRDRKKKNDKHQRKNRRYGRRVALSKRRMSAREEFKDSYDCTLPDEIFDPEFMSSCHSDLDSSEVSDKNNIWGARDEHRERKLDKAGISEESPFENVEMWELRRKEFRSKVFTEILQWLDGVAQDLSEQRQQRQRRNSRPTIAKVDLGRNIKRAPAEGHRVFPFMVDSEWLRDNEEEGKKLEIEEKDPDDFINAIEGFMLEYC
ncbi:uncharacterized protein FOMMEDRAFT_166947 [Fomitiporia mediterranea MF3/22]|uniref:uncharacterized protein n=1 Tax=Fomitiporia mediterranea (strain MF3/22) TaxID=694068 RepID=UPI0004407733|nr:uncharacterized protein FOMMEDRAFT_166947 [Fomitiporia mediterranea MF3/22]EJD03574.1 hypothetical protein FOMMEDRAFT_166947 [Fomitiporia mediterranea MF3/22]